jgi:hypothetical protein
MTSSIFVNVFYYSVLSDVKLRQPMTIYLLVLSGYDALHLLARLFAVHGEWLIYGLTKSTLFQLKLVCLE